MITEIVRRYICSEGLMQPGRKVLVGVSGGADSVALLHVLLDLGYSCEAIHCNFGLRGGESDRDEAFVRALCSTKGVPLEVVGFDTTGYAREHRVSIEMAARELRYAYFERMRLERGAQAIAVAHHRDDSVETLLLNLMRGTGIHGLCGMRSRNGFVVRPLLCVSRADVLEYLQSIRQDYVTDSTNLQDAYTRNKIRLHLLPLMQEINPSVYDTLAATAERLSDVEAIYNKVIKEKRHRVMTILRPDLGCIDIGRFRQETEQKALLYELLSPYGFKTDRVSDVYASMDAESGRRFYSPTHEVLRDRDCWLIYPRQVEEVDEECNMTDESGSLCLPGGTGVLTWYCRPLTDDFVIPRQDRSVACLDADKFAFPLTVRRWRQGDTFVPFGMRGRKKLSDYMTDRKFTRRQKEMQCLVCHGERIMWLVGERSDDRFKIDGTTRRICVIKVK